MTVLILNERRDCYGSSPDDKHDFLLCVGIMVRTHKTPMNLRSQIVEFER